MYFINPIEENVVWVTTEDDAIGIEVRFDSDVCEEEKALIALSEYLGYEPKSILCLDSIDSGITWKVLGGKI